MPVPNALGQKGQARQMATNQNNHCGIDSTHSLTCWSDANGNQFKFAAWIGSESMAYGSSTLFHGYGSERRRSSWLAAN